MADKGSVRKTSSRNLQSEAIMLPAELTNNLHHYKLVNNATFHDVVILAEKQQIFSHTVILNSRAPALLKPKDKKISQKKKKNITEVTVEHITHKTLMDVMVFVYTGNVDFSKLNVAGVLALNAAAIDLQLERLQWLCEHNLRTNLSLENIFPVLKGAYALHQQSVMDFCYPFILSKYDDFISQKEQVKDLGIDLFQLVVEVYQDSLRGVTKTYNVPQQPINTIVGDFKKIYEEMQFVDVHFRVGSETIPAHKAIVGGPTAELTALCTLAPAPKTKDHPTEAIILPPIKGKDASVTLTPAAFRSFCKFVYYGETQIAPLNAVELIPFARDYNMLDLLKVCEKIVEQNIRENTALPTLATTYLPQMEPSADVAKLLKENSIDYILAHLEEIDLTPLRKMNPNIAVDILLTHQEQEKRRKGVSTGPALHHSSNSSTVSLTTSPSSSNNKSTPNSPREEVKPAIEVSAPVEEKDPFAEPAPQPVAEEVKPTDTTASEETVAAPTKPIEVEVSQLAEDLKNTDRKSSSVSATSTSTTEEPAKPAEHAPEPTTTSETTTPAVHVAHEGNTEKPTKTVSEDSVSSASSPAAPTSPNPGDVKSPKKDDKKSKDKKEEEKKKKEEEKLKKEEEKKKKKEEKEKKDKEKKEKKEKETKKTTKDRSKTREDIKPEEIKS